MDPKVEAGVWRLADPKISLASLASLLLGACAAARLGPIPWGWLALAVLGILALEAGKNASGEVFDWDSGDDQAVAPEDRSPFSGGKRVLVDGLLTRRQTWAAARTGYALCALAGAVIALFHEPGVLYFGLAGAALAWFYHAPPFKLSYRGFGELAVSVAYGPLIACGLCLALAHRVAPGLFRASCALGVLIASFLVINEIPDYKADAAAGKKNLVVRLGRGRAAVLFALMQALAVLVVPHAAWPGLLYVPFGFAAARRLLKQPNETPLIIPAQSWTLLAFLVYAVGAGIGILDYPRG